MRAIPGNNRYVFDSGVTGAASGHGSQADRPTRGFVIVLATLVVLALVIVALLPSRRTVPVVGDSITVLSAPAVGNAFGDAYRPDIEAVLGQRIDQMLPALKRAVAPHPYAVVVNLGTNDVIQWQRHPDWRTGFNQMVAILTSQRCAVLTTISTEMPPGVGNPNVAYDINAAIEDAVQHHPNFHVLDWNAEIRSRGVDTLLIQDHVHPTPAGQKRLAAMIRGAVDNDCRHSVA